MIRAVALCVVLLSSTFAFADDTWSGGGGNANWSTAANWSSAPATGDNLIFPNGAMQLTNTNDLGGASVALLTVSGNGYTLGGNGLTLTAGFTSSAATTGPALNLSLTINLPQTFTNTGATVTMGGALALNGALTLAGTGNFALNGATSGAGQVIMNGTGNATFAAAGHTGGFQVNTGTITLTAAPPGVGAIAVGAAGTLAVNGVTITAQAPITLAAGAHMTTAAGPIWDKVVTLAGAATISSSSNLGSSFFLQGGFPSTALAGTGPLTLVGGSITIGAPSTYTGGTHLTVYTGVICYLGLGDDAALGTGALAIDDGCTAQLLAPANTSANPVTIGSPTATKAALLSVENGSSGAWTGAITLANSKSTIDSQATSFTVGAIGGAGSLNTTGGGILILTGAGTWAGGTNITQGTVQLGTGGSLPSTTAVVIDATTTLDLNDHDTTIGSLASEPNVADHFVKLGTATLTAGGDGTSTTFSGQINGTGGVVFNGAGVKRITTAQIYTGPTTVGGGTLLLDGGALASASAVAVHAGATLAYGNAGVSGPVTSAGGIVAPGTTTPRTGTSGNLTLDSASTFAVILDGTTAGASSTLSVNGTATLGSAKLSANVMTALTMGDSFVIIQNDGTDAVVGTFAGAAEGSVVTTGGASFKVSYHAGDGNDVSITATSDVAAPDLAGNDFDFAGVDFAGVDLSSIPFDLGSADGNDKFRSEEKGCGCEVGAREPMESGFTLVLAAAVALYVTRRRARSR